MPTTPGPGGGRCCRRSRCPGRSTSPPNTAGSRPGSAARRAAGQVRSPNDAHGQRYDLTIASAPEPPIVVRPTGPERAAERARGSGEPGLRSDLAALQEVPAWPAVALVVDAQVLDAARHVLPDRAGTQGSAGPGAAPPDTAPGLADPMRIASTTAIDHRATDRRRLRTRMRAPPPPDHPAAEPSAQARTVGDGPRR